MTASEKDTSLILGSLQEKGDTFSKLSMSEKKRSVDLIDAIDHIIDETEKYRSMAKAAAIEVMNLHILTPNPAYSRADGVNIGKDAANVTMKVLVVLEAKLNKLLQRKSEVLKTNKDLKTEISHFRRLRIQTDVAHAKNEIELAETKANIERMLADSAATVEERDRLLEKRDALERLNKEEQLVFEEEYERMGQFIKEQNNALEEALLKERKLEMAEKRNGIKAVSKQLKRVSKYSLAEEIEMAKQVGNLTSYVVSEENSLSGIQTKINNYEAIFEQLQKMTGTSNLEEVISSYVGQEEEMFSLYNFIQTVNAEIDAVQESSAQIESAIAKYKEEALTQDEHRSHALLDLQQRLSTTLASIHKAEHDSKIYQESVAQISKKVSSLFFKLQCDQMDTKAGGGVGGGSKASGAKNSAARPEGRIAMLTSQGVTESNVLEYMGCIEQRSVDIISEYLRHTAAEGRRSPTPGPPSPMHWPSDPVVDINEFAEEEFLMLDDNINRGNISNAADNDCGPMDKIIDLNAYKEKLQRKLSVGIANNHGFSLKRGSSFKM